MGSGSIKAVQVWVSLEQTTSSNELLKHELRWHRHLQALQRACCIDARGQELGRGRIKGNTISGFAQFFNATN